MRGAVIIVNIANTGLINSTISSENNGTHIELYGAAGSEKLPTETEETGEETMTKLRGYIPTMLMLVTLMFGATAANAGIIITNRTEAESTKTDGDPCTEEGSSLTKLADTVATFLKTGIIITNRTGIIITNRDSQETCGIIITN